MPHPLVHEAERQALKIVRKYQIRRTHDGVMVWIFTDQWKWHRPFASRDQAEEYLFNLLPAVESER